MIGKAANFMLHTIEDAESSNTTETFLGNIRLLFELIECNTTLIDLIEWMHIANKFYDHLRSLKTKTIQITVRNK